MRRIALSLLVLLAFTIPWEYSLDLGEPLGNISRITGLILLVIVIPSVLLDGRIRTPGPTQILVLAFYVWLCCSLFWSIEPAETFRHLRGYFQVLMIVWLVWELVDTPQDLRNLLRAYMAGCWVLAALTVSSFIFPASPDQVRFVAEGQDPNDVARFLDLGLPMAALLLGSELRWPGKLLAAGYLPLGLLGVLLTASRTGFVGALVALAGCGLLLLRNHRRGFAGALLASPLAVAAFWLTVPQPTLERIASIPVQLQNGDLNQRWDIWAAGWHAFVRAPFFGSGAGTFVSAAGLAPIDTAHNTVLSLAVGGGVFAVVLALAVVVASAAAVMKTDGPVRIALATCLITCLVMSLVATVEENRSTWLLLGLISAAARVSEEAPEFMMSVFPANSWRMGFRPMEGVEAKGSS